MKGYNEVILKEMFEDILEALVCITAFLVVPLTICFGLYITKNPLCLIALILCYKLNGNKDKTNHDKDDKHKVEEE